MNLKTLCVAASCAAGLLFSVPAAAQNAAPNRFAFDIGGGFSTPVYHTDGRTDMGFNVKAGAGINFTRHVGILGEFGFDRLGLSPRILNNAGFPGGNMHIFSVTANPIVHFNPTGRVDPYVIGGGGFYRRTVEFTQPTVANVTLFDPFLGVFFNTPVAANAVAASFTQNKGGLNIGGGLGFRVKQDSNFKIFAEARYHYIFTTPVRTTVLPVTFGFRW